MTRTFITIAMATFALLPGCAPTINSFAKQLFTAQQQPRTDLALRGSCDGQTVVCQVFLTKAKGAWIWDVRMKMPDGTILKAYEIQPIESETNTIPVSFWFWGEQSGPEGFRRISGEGSGFLTSQSERAGPLWRAFGGGDPPRALECTYKLPEGETTCEQYEFTVLVTRAPKGKIVGKGKPDDLLEIPFDLTDTLVAQDPNSPDVSPDDVNVDGIPDEAGNDVDVNADGIPDEVQDPKGTVVVAKGPGVKNTPKKAPADDQAKKDAKAIVREIKFTMKSKSG